MPLINTSVPNLIQGVSQQPDATRHAGQCEEQENALSSVVDGLKKRPNTRHVARLLTTAIDEDSFVHFINRDTFEKYVIIHDGSKLRVFNLRTGNEGTINGASNKYYDPADDSYLDTSTPRRDLKALTIADRTFLLNKSKNTSLKNDTNNQVKTTPDLEKKSLVFVKQGDYKKLYGITVTTSLDSTVNIGSGGTATVTWAGTTTRTGGGRGWDEYTTTWSISSATVSDGGSNYSGTPTLQFSGVTTLSSQNVTFSINAAGEAVGPTTITNAGSFAGVGTTSTGSTYIGNKVTTYGVNPPSYGADYEANIVDLNVIPAGATITASCRSGDTATKIDSHQILYDLHVDNGADDIASKLGTLFNVKRSVNLLEMERTDGTDFKITGLDGLSGNGIGVIYKEVDSISDLPTVAPDGFVVKVRGDAELSQDDFYVKFETNLGITSTSGNITSTVGQGSWVETVSPSINAGVASESLPLSFINTGEDTFVIEETKFAERTVGDDNTNPLPSFIGHRIENMFFFKNRLGFLSNENVILSEAGLGAVDDAGDLVINFGRTSVTALLDSDPIDVSVSSSRITSLKAAKGFQENLVLFAENGQFILKGGDVLTPKTVSITPITNFNVEGQVDPLPLGSYIYFPFTRGTYTGLREFTLNASTDVYDSVEVTEHVPAYIPDNIIDIAGTTTEDTIMLLSGEETDALYIYHYFWNNNQKVLSSWSKFTFDDDIRGIEFINSTLYMVTVDDHNNTHLLELPMEADAAEVDYNGNAAPFRTLVDKRVRAKIDIGNAAVEFEQSNGTYSSANADLPYTYYNGSPPSGGATLSEVFVDSDGNEYALKYQDIGSGGQVLLSNGNATSTSYGYVGLPYTMKYKFSTQIFKASSGNSASPTAASSMQVRNGVLFFDDTHTFDVKVTPDGRSEVTETFSADDRPEAETLGNRKFAEGNFRFPVHSKAKNVEIVVENDSPFDSKFSSAEFESFVHPRSRRYG